MIPKHLKDFRIEISAWIPFYETKDYALQASDFSSAVSKGIKLFRREVGQQWIQDLDIKVVRL